MPALPANASTMRRRRLGIAPQCAGVAEELLHEVAGAPWEWPLEVAGAPQELLREVAGAP